ncbi:LacI family DNA-binding transcriptional regulator [Nakamurella sp. YIM 132087]|uniref:LacI family DNA-binding transcriptional regulator n=1 Tax=Nakamurella alba TaxID=2665158 RepID=A0A7K1FEV9_9ACTN|nr:LacI family DNA-binding transcriptional regulator [Nakamurella alba]MTD12641.1 LacI family DNA-binding transcriptional regulator [Nakamurella alba]
MPGRSGKNRQPTIYAVAERAGVSIATVSRVLGGSSRTSERSRSVVLAAASDLGWEPASAARSLAARTYQAHGLLLGGLSGPYYADILIGYEAAAARYGQSLVVTVADGTDQGIAVRRLAARTDGIAVLASAVADEVLVELTRTHPVVVLGGAAPAGCDAVVTESTGAAAELTTHLLGHGRRALRFVGDPAGSFDGARRHEGFRQAVRVAGLRPAAPLRTGTMTEQDGRAVADRVARSSAPIDALVCANDELALAVVRRLETLGVRVPDDVAVVGWDDVTAARYLRPGLTTVRQPVFELGELGCTVLHDRIGGAPVAPDPRELPTTLVIRGSCGCREPPW